MYMKNTQKYEKHLQCEQVLFRIKVYFFML